MNKDYFDRIYLRKCSKTLYRFLLMDVKDEERLMDVKDEERLMDVKMRRG